MTPEQLRKIDALVAEKVMGWLSSTGYRSKSDGSTDMSSGMPIWSVDCGKAMLEQINWNPCSNIKDAWEVVEKADLLFRTNLVKDINGWAVFPDHGDAAISYGLPTAPLAICLAALKAVGVDYTSILENPSAL